LHPCRGLHHEGRNTIFILAIFLFSWLQYYLQFASEESILFLDQHGKADMVEISPMLVVGPIVADPSEGGP
jgi:hypothetical protein